MKKQPYWTDDKPWTVNEVKQREVEDWLNGCEFTTLFLRSDIYKLEKEKGTVIWV